jgi:hypothetical protein
VLAAGSVLRQDPGGRQPHETTSREELLVDDFPAMLEHHDSLQDLGDDLLNERVMKELLEAAVDNRDNDLAVNRDQLFRVLPPLLPYTSSYLQDVQHTVESDVNQVVLLVRQDLRDSSENLLVHQESHDFFRLVGFA